MSVLTASFEKCPCGLPVALPVKGAPGTHLDVPCECGRRLDFRRAARGWVLAGEIFSEGSVPVEGFSRDLRQESDAQRFWFPLVERTGRRVHVHVVFSRRSKRAEIKHSDVKALSIRGVDTPTEARRRWLDWWGSPPKSADSRVDRLPGAPRSPAPDA